MELHIRIIGFLLIVLALIHVGFPRYFGWKRELASLSLINRQMMYVHMFFIALMVLLMGLLCVCCATEMQASVIGRYVAAGFSVFWLLRLVFQLFVYSPRLWKGKAFETGIHICFTLLWAYLAVVFFLVYLGV
jgi:hypothetical protein